MDPDLMMSFAEMGCSQLPPPPRWNTSTTAVYEFEDPVPYEDEEGGALMFSGSQSQRGLLDSAIDGEDDADLDGAPMSLGQDEAQQHGKMKRRWSTRFGQALADFGKIVKRRTDSWGKRKDSVAAPDPPATDTAAVLSGGAVGRRELSASPPQGSGGRSRDGDDEMSSSEEELLRFTTTASGQRLPWQTGASGQIRPDLHVHYAYPAEQLRRAAADGEQDVHSLAWRLHDEEEQRRLHRHPREHLALMEREVRIAERQGAFTDAAFEKKFKKAHRRLQRADSEQSQASIKLKAKVARKKSVSDTKFRRWSETKDLSPMSRVLKRIGWRNRAELGSEAEESEARSEMPRSEEDEDEHARSRGSVASMESQDSTDEWREGNVEAVSFAGWALQRAPHSF